MENTTQLFLAVRFNCNKCHDHPFERWTQDQYYQLAAYFAQVGRKRGPEVQGPEDRRHRRRGAAAARRDHRRRASRRGQARPHRRRSPRRSSRSRTPSMPAGRRPRAASSWPSGSPRKDNPYFAKSYVNRLWSYLLGVGIIEPIDDIRAGNPPTNPELLDRLTDGVHRRAASTCRS